MEDYHFPHTEKDLKKWPIYKLSAQRDDFIQEVNEYTLQALLEKSGENIEELLAKTIYQEKIRMRKTQWKVDPPNEVQFWRRIESKLTKIKGLPPDLAKPKSKELLLRVIHRYSEEIVGNFKTKTFKFARKALTLGFKILFNKFWDKFPFWGNRRRLLRRIRVTGKLPLVRQIMNKGTVVLVPTHSSNLDSVFIGYAIDFKAGLPSFCYGAGLNLYNSEFAAYFMNRLGAYRLDRRKKNAVYLETLKTMSRRMTNKGVNNLFFPGGTRSRSGALENNLKLGILGTLIEAQRELIQEGSDQKIFVVPVVISYPFVLEARVLIDEFLQAKGKEKYFRKKYKNVKRFSKLTFFNHLFSKSQTSWVSFCTPTDVMGNKVNSDGQSLDAKQNIVDLRDYFAVGDKIQSNHQRESVYTKVLAESIVKRYHRENVVIASHFLAFVAFKLLIQSQDEKDIFELFMLEEKEIRLDWDDLLLMAKKMQSLFLEMCKNGDLKVTEDFNSTADFLIKEGLKDLSHYSARKPLKFIKGSKDLTSEDVKLLYFYHNRLNCYEEKLNEIREKKEKLT